MNRYLVPLFAFGWIIFVIAPAVSAQAAPENSFYNWLFAHFGSGRVSPEADPGGRGVSLIARFAFGLDPHDPDRADLGRAIVHTGIDGERFLALCYQRRLSSDVGIAVEASNELADWETLDDSHLISATAENGIETVTIRDRLPFSSSSKRFMRIRITPPPAPGEADPPTDVYAKRMSRLRARLSWAHSGADSYRIERKTVDGFWTEIAEVASTDFVDSAPRERGVIYLYRVTARIAGLFDSVPSAFAETTVPAIRLTMIGDSNLQRGADERNRVVVKSYVGNGPRPPVDPDDYLDHPSLISGRIPLLRPDIETVNHGIDGTESGTGFGNTNRANALETIGGFTRFEGEMLGKGYPWTEDGVARINAFTPTAADYGYYSFGVNDIHDGVSPAQIRDNIAAALDLWENEGLSANRLMITTITPRPAGENQANVPIANDWIRELIAARGAILIDTCEIVSNDNGRSWKSADYHTDGIHFSDLTCDLIAAEIVSRIPVSE